MAHKNRINRDQYFALQKQDEEKVTDIVQEEEKQEHLMRVMVLLNVRKNPYGDIQYVLNVGQQVEVVDEKTSDDGVVWAQLKDGNYTMKKFLEEV